MSSNRDAPQGRGPRRPVQLPKIDPYAANRPSQYPYSGELTPASSGHGSQVVSPKSASSSNFKAPWPMPPPPSRKMATSVVRGPPSPELISQDCAFPHFPTLPKPRSITPNSDSDRENLRKPSYTKSNLSSPRGSIHTTKSNIPKSTSRSASNASSKTTSKGRSRAKTIETKEEPSAAANMKRKPSLSNLFGMRKTPVEKMPPLPTSISSVPASRKGIKDDQPPLQTVQSAPLSPTFAPTVTLLPQNELDRTQSVNFQVPENQKPISDHQVSQAAGFGSAAQDRASVASSIYPDTPDSPVAISAPTPVHDKIPEPKEERRNTLSRLDGSGGAPGKEPSYKAKRPPPIASNLAIMTTEVMVTPRKRSPTYPIHNTDRKTGNGANGIMGRRPSDSSSALSPQKSGLSLSPIGTGKFPPNSIGNLAVPTPTSAVPSTPASFKSALTEQPATTGPRVNLNRASIDSASSTYSFDASMAHSVSSQSSPPRDEVRQEVTDLNREVQPVSLYPTDLPQPLRPRFPRMQTDSPTDPLFQNGLLSSIPSSPSASAETSAGLGSNSFDRQQPLLTSPRISPGFQQFSTDVRPRQMSNAGENRPPQLASRHLPQRSQTMGSNKGICRGCNKIITSTEKSVSSADGRLTGKYHKECFVCHSCKSPFPTADFYVLRDHPYCAHHYHELNGTLCVGCGRGVEGQYLETNMNTNATSRVFHANCLTCTTCRCQLRDDYFEFNGKPYCERDAFRAASPQPSRSQYDTAPSRPSPLSQAMLRADSEAGSRRFPERRTTKLMGGSVTINVI